MMDTIKDVAVFGSSGAMGSLTGGLIAQKGIFLSRTLQDAKSGLERAIAQTCSEVISCNIECGDYDCLLESAFEEATLQAGSLGVDTLLVPQEYAKSLTHINKLRGLPAVNLHAFLGARFYDPQILLHWHAPWATHLKKVVKRG